MTCQDARDLFSARADGALGPAEQARLHAHLETCAECQREWIRFERTVALVQAIEPAHAPAGFVDRVLVARVRPWYARLARGLFVPWPVKLPLEAAAIVLVAGLAVMIFQRSPELQQASVPPEPRTESAPMVVREPAVATAPPAKAGKKQNGDGAAPPASTPPAATSWRIDSPPEGVVPPEQRSAATSAPREQTRDATEPARDALEPARAKTRAAETPRAPTPLTAAEPQAKSDEEHKALLRKEAEERSGGRENLAQVHARPSTGLRARLAVGERAAAESTVRDLVARAGGQVLSQGKDGDAAVLSLVVPADRWDELRRGLEALGTLRVEGSKAEGTGQLLVTLRLER